MHERRLAQLRHKQQQLENRAAYYEKGDRRKRAHIHYNIYEVQHEQEHQNAAVRQKKQEIEH